MTQYRKCLDGGGSFVHTSVGSSPSFEGEVHPRIRELFKMRKRVSHGFGSVALRTDVAFQSCRGPPESGEPSHVVDL